MVFLPLERVRLDRHRSFKVRSVPVVAPNAPRRAHSADQGNRTRTPITRRRRTPLDTGKSCCTVFPNE